ncbi:tetratricopeptide repeat-containing sensor histidine kinase [Chryseolinea lacunae]|uniref:histidine kinase n=1 Tax=Chryseolinea lacunae TaxID=2801331 RepID=A0ABS1KNX2_9BACT|nr:tetratricopeptide repeat protein [Chryseolinea lacunae]MBL0741144.1 tetratricopeptide repeat-containing sensor histidine kinase [Chryseolinea lacunae]
MNDTTRVNLYYSISRHYWSINSDSSLLMAQKSLDLAESIHFKKGIALACLTKGVALESKGNYPEALNCHLRALRLSEELNLKGLSGNCYGNIGIVYCSLGNYKKAIEYYEKALAIAETYGVAATVGMLTNLSDTYTKVGDYKRALQYGLKALTIGRDEPDSSSVAISLFNLAEIYHKTGKTDQSMATLHESMNISVRIGDREGISHCLNFLATLYADKKLFSRSIDYAKRSLQNLHQTDNKELQLGAYHALYRSYTGLNDFEQALNYRNKEIALKESLFSIEKERETNTLEAQYELERKQYQIELLEKDNALRQKEISRASFETRTYALGLVFFIGLTGYLVYANSKRKKINHFLREKNAIITTQNEKINEHNARLEKLNGVKTQLISIISHDFRSPLHTLQGFIQLMNNDALKKEEIVLMTQQINDKLGVTLHLIENLLHWAISQMNGIVLHPQSFDVKGVVDENVRLVQLSADSKNITIASDLHEESFVFADRDTINITLRNLMTNAIKFSKHGDTLSISAVVKEQYLQLSVKDTGIGISEQRQKTLFEGMVSPTRMGTRNEKGTGLGLALCKELVEKNGGKIWVESEPGKGSDFMFTVPRKL